ncbi:MAG: hypothetical protein IJR68_01470 [Fretibacterium sp.]|nr:hypothetical protein [Fretibacterium sp.]
MSVNLKKHTWLKTRGELPGRLELDRVYFIADEGVFVLDHGKGPVTFGGRETVDSLEGDERDRSPSVHAVNTALANIPGGDSLYRGAFVDAAALRAAHPTDTAGAYATVLATGTMWIWNGTDWADSGESSGGAQVEVVDNLTTADGTKALSARQGVLLNGKIDQKAGAVTLTVNIPTDGWTRDEADTTGWPWRAEVSHAVITEDMIPFLAFSPAAMGAAMTAGVCPSVQTLTGKLRVFARSKPTEALTGTVTLLSPGGEILLDEDFATDEEVDNALGDIWGNN